MNKKLSTLGIALILTGGILGCNPSPGWATGGNPGHGHDPVILCHNGHTIIVDDSSVVKAHLRHGDTKGECPPEPSVPPTDPTVPPTEPTVPPTEPTTPPTEPSTLPPTTPTTVEVGEPLVPPVVTLGPSPDRCVFADGSGGSDTYIDGHGDANDRNGHTAIYIIPCHVPVDNPPPPVECSTGVVVNGVCQPTGTGGDLAGGLPETGPADTLYKLLIAGLICLGGYGLVRASKPRRY